MKSFFFYRALRSTIIQFLDLMNDIQIPRYQSDGATINKYVKVPVKFSPKEKVWYWLNERKDDSMLPIISVNMESIEHSADRKGSPFHHIVKSKDLDLGTVDSFISPVPFDINFVVQIWSLYMIDIDAILEQIIPYFNPYVFIRVNIPELDATMNIKVLFESASPDMTLEISDEEHRVIKWLLNFRVQSYLFQPVTSDTDELIKKIYANIYQDETMFNNMIGTESTYSSGASASESLYIRTDPTSAGEYYDADGAILYSYEVLP